MPKANFRWIVPDKLAGSHNPDLRQLKQYRKWGINAIVCLQTCGIHDELGDYDTPRYTPQQAKELGYEILHMPIPDGLPPTKQQMSEFVEYSQAPGRATVVHCYAGIGRTGCMLAAYLGETENLSGIEALRKLRKTWLEYIQTPGQELAVKDYLDEVKLIREK